MIQSLGIVFKTICVFIIFLVTCSVVVVFYKIYDKYHVDLCGWERIYEFWIFIL